MTFKEQLKTWPEWVATLVVMMIIAAICAIAIILSLVVGSSWIICASFLFLVFYVALIIVRSIRCR